MKVLVLKTFKARETGKVVRPGQYLDYPADRAADLAAGGWVKIAADTELAEKAEITELQPEKTEVNEIAAKAKVGRKAKSEK